MTRKSGERESCSPSGERRTGTTSRWSVCHFGIPSPSRARLASSHAAPSRIGGWKDSAVSHGKKIQVSCDTSVMKVSTSGRPFGLA